MFKKFELEDKPWNGLSIIVYLFAVKFLLQKTGQPVSIYIRETSENHHRPRAPNEKILAKYLKYHFLLS